MLDGRRVRSYRCVPLVQQPGDKKAWHYFGLAIEDSRPLARWQPAPTCARHPDGKIVRNGVYGKGDLPRQRYRCTPPGGKAHVFTPTLPREHVSVDGQPCSHCDEIRGIHRGETAVARRHRFTTGTVTRGLEDLSKGQPYTKVSLEALKNSGYAIGSRRRRERSERPKGQVHGDISEAEDLEVGVPPAPPLDAALSTEPADLWQPANPDSGEDEPDGTFTTLRESQPVQAGVSWLGAQEADWQVPERPRRKSTSESSRRKRAAWRIAANWIDAFSPVIWEPIEAKLRAEALAERSRLDALIAAGKPVDWPQILIVDDSPVWGRAGVSKRRDGGFYLLIVAEVIWIASPDPAEPIKPDTRIRLIRAMPKSNTSAWRLVFEELGYTPDFVIADAGTGIEPGIRAHFDSRRTTFIPSLWHVKKSIRRALGVDSISGYNATVERHLRELSRDGTAFESDGQLVEWWNELEAIALAEGLKEVAGQRRKYAGPLRAVLSHLRTTPGIPLATGGLESIMRSEIDPVLVNRTQFGNIVRTNQLFDLVVARIHGAFSKHGAVARQLRRDAEAFDGWTIALRAYDDPQPERGRYSSLRDATLLASNAVARGLA